MVRFDPRNKGQAGVPFYTPAQEPAAGTAADPASAPTLFQPLRIRSLELHNRFVVSPMCQYSADNGHLTDYHLVHLGQFAFKGAAVVSVEATATEPRGRISPQDSGLWQDSQIEPLRRIVNYVHSQNTKAAIQIAHAGRKASTLAPWIGGSVHKALAEEADGGWPDDVVGPSAIPFGPGYAEPKELSAEEIGALIQSFAESAVRAVKAGFDIVEIHGAHGYLITEFLSPLSNHRTDKYGGSFENRTRFLREIIEAVRGVIPEKVALWVRISATEWMEHAGKPSWDLESSIKLAKLLPALGVDVLDVSSGGNSFEQKIPHVKTYQTNLAREIRRALRADSLDLIVGSVGNIDTPEFARDIVQEGGEEQSADLALAARQFLREPDFVLKAADKLGVPVKWPVQYHRAEPKSVHDAFKL
ncbi:uncharacterized protein UV8b_02486 [Ustilaginoidea virens]|uniref:NADH:flavin oxidoreductase/NADH oxidase N-terminal domain-containing protein n=1 Tax=Ustilaginoidea virens TaxID=1159556 RepID=A0A8E5HML2_USTVR|nr:uncharacterized protein UV8b_02486 [Ustilaginoidea virens]QUC18245.1 hypothetical protein UV8b_02486 [Ustilaginoidea virens]